MEVKIIAYVILGIFLGPVASLAITPVFCLLWKIFYLPFIRKGLLEKAKENGHVVEAHLIKSHNIRNHNTNGVPLPTMEDMGTYRYEVNGKTYRYRLLSTTGIPKTITLYYINEPQQVLEDFPEEFRKRYDVECVSALHHNKRKTNYHIDLIFSERRLLTEPDIKIATRNVFYNETGKRVHAKKESTNENGKVRL